MNGISEVVVSPIDSRSAAPASADIKVGDASVKASARSPGAWGNRVKVNVEERAGVPDSYRVMVSCGDVSEVYDNIYLDPENERFIEKMINAQSDMIKLSVTEARKSKKKEGEAAPAGGFQPTEAYLAGGKGASVKDYERALEKLESEEDVDLLAASIEDFSKPDEVNQVYRILEAHAKKMSDICMNRIALGESPPSTMFRNADSEVEEILRQKATMSSDRFIYVAPHGVLGAVVGLLGSITPHTSPTYKAISGVKGLERKYSPSQLKQLLVANTLVLEEKRGKGIIVEKGICSSGEQISVQRVADRAVRGVKMIGDLFIGTLNNLNGRSALKEKITEFFIQMEKDGAIVPSADGTDPSYKIDVYASDDDISKGIVRVDIAVRPVRAIDYIYGTILVRA
jgi:hypothetical protein